MKKCLVAMSGGVDSSVCAYLLKNAGYEIAGATMKLLDNEATNQAIDDAKKVCECLGIKHYVLDLQEEFQETVIHNFITTYQEGKTPNPCVLCNKRFKFDLFYKEAVKLGFSMIATGHYAKIKDGKLYRSKNLAKDQSYFLYGINREILNHVLFPLAEFHSKEEVRHIAGQLSLSISSKKDSQEVCFVPNDDYKAFLKRQIKSSSIGQICLKDGTVLGTHRGISYYTIGQRKGLGISYSHPLYVTDLDPVKNLVIVGSNDDLYHDTLIAGEISLLVDKLPSLVQAKVRSRGCLQNANITILEDGRIKVLFQEKQRAITKGQSVVFYEKDQCLGGGIIEEIF